MPDEKLPAAWVAEGLALAQGATVHGYNLSELSRDELIAVAAHGWKYYHDTLHDSFGRRVNFRNLAYGHQNSETD